MTGSQAGSPRGASDGGGDITRLLDEAEEGSPLARERLLQTVYDELRRIANALMRGERADHTLGATALVNESYLKLFREPDGSAPGSFAHRHAFYKAAATAMRRILIDHARARATAKRSMPRAERRISADLVEAATQSDPHDLLSLDHALSRLEEEDERAAGVVRLRFFAGRQLDEIAELFGVSTRTIKRDWEFARARLQELMEQDEREA
jgi:RNA polymerase sigma factor (TIGR02999 family)